jgi:hypothetical protein
VDPSIPRDARCCFAPFGYVLKALLSPKNEYSSHAVRTANEVRSYDEVPAISRAGSYPTRSSHTSLPPTVSCTVHQVRFPSALDSTDAMSSIPLSDSALPAYDDAEKGTLELHSGPITNMSSDEKPKLPTSDASARATKPPAKAKKEVSRWILWTLWFNTYRSVSIMSTSCISNPASDLDH